MASSTGEKLLIGLTAAALLAAGYAIGHGGFGVGDGPAGPRDEGEDERPPVVVSSGSVVIDPDGTGKDHQGNIKGKGRFDAKLNDPKVAFHTHGRANYVPPIGLYVTVDNSNPACKNAKYKVNQLDLTYSKLNNADRHVVFSVDFSEGLDAGRFMIRAVDSPLVIAADLKSVLIEPNDKGWKLKSFTVSPTPATGESATCDLGTEGKFTIRQVFKWTN